MKTQLLSSVLSGRAALGLLGGAAFFGLVACAPAIGDGVAPGSGGNTASGGTGTGAGGTGTGGAGTGGSIGGAVGTPELPSSCASSTPGSRLLRRLTQRELTNSQEDVFGTSATSGAPSLPGDPLDKVRLSNDVATLEMNQDTAIALLDRAEEIAGKVTAADALPAQLPCASSSPDEACATEFIQKYGQGLFRRPVAQADVDRYLALYRSIAAESDFNMALKWVLVGLIQSPYAVYRTELGSGGKLDPYELASELSYNYSASPPSAELLALALDGSLNDPEIRFQEAKKLLATPRGLGVLLQFFGEWLSYKNVLTVARETTSDFESVRPKLVQETELFLQKLLVEKSGKLSDLMTADYTYADAALASYYGFSGGSGDLGAGTAGEVERTYGLGVFGQGSVTAGMASIAITSPTRRGLLLLKRLFCETPPLPEAINFDLTVDTLAGNTTRERLENSHLQPGCLSCHQNFDPLGFAFEHIDNVGRYREQEVTDAGSFPIDATATVAKLENLEVDGEEELMTALAQDEDVLSCISGTMARYVYGGSGTCREPAARARAMAGETSIVDFLAELAKEPHFTNRQP